MSADLLTSIKKHFGYLLKDYGFKLIEAEDFNSFDNAVVTLSSSDLHIRFVRERGKISVQIASIPFRERYFEFDFIWLVIEKRSLSEIPNEMDIETLSKFLKRHYFDIQEKFSKEKIEATITELEAVKEEWLRRKYPDAYD